MSKMSDFVVDTLQRLVNFLADGTNFLLGIVGAALITALSLSGEVIDEITTYQTLKTAEGFPWAHVAKVMIPPMAVSIGAYIQHRKAVATALNSAPREIPATMVKQ